MNPDNSSQPDPLQPKDDIFNPNVDEVRLPQDGANPAAPADDTVAPDMPQDYPTTDTSVDADEAYDEGVAHAAGIGVQEVEPDTRVKPVELDHQD